jgi:hypothetical protein
VDSDNVDCDVDKAKDMAVTQLPYIGRGGNGGPRSVWQIVRTLGYMTLVVHSAPIPWSIMIVQ